MNIGLIFPNKDRRYKTVHLGLASIAAYARQFHHDIHFELLDTRVATKKETNHFFLQNFDLIGITVFSPVYQEVSNIFQKIRYKHPATKICLGGPYTTTIMEEIFRETPAEFAIIGEGELSFSNLISYLKGEFEITNIKGLIYRDNDQIIINPPADKVQDLDSLPFPAYDIFPMHRYPVHRLVTSRGCQYACVWCNSSSIWGNGCRMMSADKMILELEHLIKNYGKKIVVFGDNSFNANMKRVDEFCDKLICKKIDILWSVSLRPDLLTRELANKMKMAGCFNVAIGVESSSNEILKRIGKGTTIEKITEGIMILNAAGIEVMSQYVIGNPGDTLETIKDSIAYAKRSGADYVNFYTVLPFKGTKQWDYIAEHGTLFYSDIHRFHNVSPRIVFETPEFPYKDRLEAIKLVKKEGFYSNKDKKNLAFDIAKDISLIIQKVLPKSLGEKLYMALKFLYRLKIVKKNNI